MAPEMSGDGAMRNHLLRSVYCGIAVLSFVFL